MTDILIINPKAGGTYVVKPKTDEDLKTLLAWYSLPPAARVRTGESLKKALVKAFKQAGTTVSDEQNEAAVAKFVDSLPEGRIY